MSEDRVEYRVGRPDASPSVEAQADLEWLEMFDPKDEDGERFKIVVARIRAALDEADREKETVYRCWKALGIETYDQAKPLAIDEHIDRLRKRVASLEEELRLERLGPSGRAREAGHSDKCSWVTHPRALWPCNCGRAHV